MRKAEPRRIEVWADWAKSKHPIAVGLLHAIPSRGSEIFSFEYDKNWLEGNDTQSLDPALRLYRGRQYTPEGQENFGIFLDSSPDRWGRLLMKRREAHMAREESRPEHRLLESDYLLGVYDRHRMGALRFRTEPNGPFLDDNKLMASPPWTSLRELEYASLELEREGAEKKRDYGKWLKMLIAPGASLGGARPKASVVDSAGNLWIAKFPSRHDDVNIGAWEEVINRLASLAQIRTAPSQVRKLSGRHHTFLTKRFDRTSAKRRIHFASAMTLLQRSEGYDASKGASYLEIAEFIMREGASPEKDLEQLWRRIVFFICVSNVDDHLRNHGFLLEPTGWRLSPSFDMNPVAFGDGLNLNISETDNTQSLELAQEVSFHFRVKTVMAKKIIRETVSKVKDWRAIASSLKINANEREKMATAFRIADRY
ncbi:MAG: HipA domain-containing protein [Proteobacteria bacterium]|nr:HipA domain-containing protein [Pseudomonadota bacterium]